MKSLVLGVFPQVFIHLTVSALTQFWGIETSAMVRKGVSIVSAMVTPTH